MTGDTTPQDRADDLISAFLANQFGDTLWPAHLGRLATQLAGKLADAGLLCSSPVVQPQQDEDGSLRSEPSAAGELSAHASPTTYQVSCLPLDHRAAHHLSVWVKWRGENRWVVSDGFMCLSGDGQWEFEPLPSSRTDEWIATHRFELVKALRLAREAAPHLTVNGLTVQDVLEGKFRG